MHFRRMTVARLSGFCWGILLCSACSTGTPNAGKTLPPEPSRVVERNRWAVGNWEGLAEYSITRNARIESVSRDRASQTTSLETHETLRRTLTTAGATVSLQVTRSASPAVPHGGSLAQVSAELAGSQFRYTAALSPDVAVQAFGGCDPEVASLQADLADIAIALPRQLTQQTTWSDSVAVEACMAGFPGRSLIRRRFQIDGDTLIADVLAILITRRDTISADASGALQQHPITLSAAGTAVARLYVSVDSGKTLGLQKRLSLRVSAVTASKSDVFLESSESTIALLANPRVGAALPGRGMTPDLSSLPARPSPHARVP